jgi:hypothetical protein
VPRLNEQQFGAHLTKREPDSSDDPMVDTMDRHAWQHLLDPNADDDSDS